MSQDQVQSDHDDVENNSSEMKPKNSKAQFAVLAAILLVLALIGFGLWKAYQQPKVIELQGRVEAESINVSTKVPSRIEELYVTEGQLVQKGQPLVRLSSPEVENKKRQALGLLQAALAAKQAVDRGAQVENIETLYATWQSLKAQEVLAQETFRRGENLFKEGVISRQRRDQMFAASRSATELAEAARQQYLRAKRGSTVEMKEGANAQVAIAQAAVDEANSLLSETQLMSPITGTISNTFGKNTEFVGLGVPIVTIIENDKMWVSLNVREDQYDYLYKKKEIEGYIPALNKKMLFKISSINVEGDFATIKNTRQTGGYDIRSFKFHLTPTVPDPNLKIGMSVLVKVEENK